MTVYGQETKNNNNNNYQLTLNTKFFFISSWDSQSKLTNGWTWLWPNSYFIFGLAELAHFQSLKAYCNGIAWQPLLNFIDPSWNSWFTWTCIWLLRISRFLNGISLLILKHLKQQTLISWTIHEQPSDFSSTVWFQYRSQSFR